MARTSKAQVLDEATDDASAAPAAGRASDAAGLDQLTSEAQNLASATATWAVSSMVHKLDAFADRLSDSAERGGSGAPVKTFAKKVAGAGIGAIKERVAPGKQDEAKQPHATNIVEAIDIGVPVRLAYDQWTQFTEFPRFTKKVEGVSQESDEKLVWRAKIWWSRREWESTIVEQVPDRRIVWRSKGAKGHVDGAVTFHELAPELTRIILVLEYHPQGLFERTANLWRAQGRRARLELKHFRRHVMTQSLLHPDEVEGWRGEIRDGEVVADDSTDADAEDKPRPSEETARSRRPTRPATRRTDGARGSRRATSRKGR